MVFANTGLPMLFVHMPVLLLALLPVILIEASVYRAGVPLTWGAAVRGSLVANLWSTLLGIPVAWFALVIAQLILGGGGMWNLEIPLLRLAAVLVQAPWLPPYEDELYWMIPAASLALLVPFYLVSVWVELRALRPKWPTVTSGKLRLLVAGANAFSYALLAGYWLLRLLYAEPWASD